MTNRGQPRQRDFGADGDERSPLRSLARTRDQRPWSLGLVAASVLIAAGCGSAASSPNPQIASAPTARTSVPQAASITRSSRATASVDRQSRTQPGPATTVKVMRTAYGNVLVDSKGRALYLFTRDRTPRSQCYTACAENWPPFLTTGSEPVAGAGAEARLAGSTHRRDGSTQVTYRGHPLYYYVGDKHPGQVLCQNVEEFGGRWYVVRSSGKPVQ
jgi:predicted lipoprotein with Yx(FWY)xxD motif